MNEVIFAGDKDNRAYNLDNGYMLLLERRKDGMDYTIVNERFTCMEEGFLEQPLADMDAISELIASQRNRKVVDQASFEYVLSHTIAAATHNSVVD